MYTVTKTDENGTSAVTGQTNVNVASTAVVYDVLADKITDTVKEWLQVGDLTGENKVEIISKSINTLISKSLDAVQQQEELNKRMDLISQQILDSKSSVKVREEQSAKDLLAKEQQIKDSKASTDFRIAQTRTEKIKQNRQYGAIVEDDGSIIYSISGNSVIEKQIAGFDMSNLKSILQQNSQALGMIYNSGEEIPKYIPDTMKRVTELLSSGKINFTTVGEDTTLTPATNWETN